MNYRSKPLLEVVRASPCQLCGAQDGTVVAAHSNQQRVDMVLNTSKVSEELEMACLSLWVGEQNRKYAEKVK